MRWRSGVRGSRVRCGVPDERGGQGVRGSGVRGTGVRCGVQGQMRVPGRGGGCP